MPQFTNTRRVRHAAADMFQLVADVERYPEFVPLCGALKVRRRIPEPEGVEIVFCERHDAFLRYNPFIVNIAWGGGRSI